jgi:hypothetical protein
MVDRFRETQFKYLSLQSPFQEIFDFESKYVIQFHAGFVEDTNSNETTDQGVSFEKTTRVSFCRTKLMTGIKEGGRRTFEGEKLTSSTADFGESKLDTPSIGS